MTAGDAALRAYERGDLNLAMTYVRRWLRLEANHSRAWELMGLIQYARGRYAISVSALERASFIVPLRQAARVCLGHGYGKIGRTNLSRDLLADMISDATIPIPLLLQIAVGLDAVDSPQLAMKACRTACRRDPDFAQPYYDLGYYAARCGSPAGITEGMLRKAIELDTDNVRYRMGLASFLARQERFDEAYVPIKEITVQQIEQIACRCCLERIIDVFRMAHDVRHVILCQQQILKLEALDVKPDCE